MSDQNLFLPLCGIPLLIFISIVAILGMRARFKFANRLRDAYQDKEKMDNWLKTHNQNKQRVFLLIALVSILGTLALGLLIASGILSMSIIVLIVFIALIVLCIISGIILLMDLDKLSK